MVDSFGKPGSGIMDGNLQWYGSFEQCKSVADYKNTSANVDFSGLYCLSMIQQRAKVGSIRISLKEKQHLSYQWQGFLDCGRWLLMCIWCVKLNISKLRITFILLDWSFLTALFWLILPWGSSLWLILPWGSSLWLILPWGSSLELLEGLSHCIMVRRDRVPP